ncbi:uncharacterized protein [Periplaneta americana]|uniref:uncharacterized protein isoform X2 n=1 Tax=Periplaneta americana TaxID=6978 RepID=UPI0037E9581C
MAMREEAHYKKTGGACRIEGYMYEFKMPGLIFLRLINERKSFHIASNMEAAGKFDDLVLRIDGIPTFVQLKHKLGAQNSAERRYNVHRIFAMKEHYSSYCDLKKKWEEKTDLQLWGPFSDVHFVVYTNAVVTVGEAIDTDVQNVLMTGGKCFRFSENDFPKLKNEPDFNKFLHQFRFYTEQASQEELDYLIRTELRRALGTDSQFQTFLTNVENWMKDPLTYLTENVEFWKDMVKCSVSDLNREKVDQLAIFNLQFDETELILFRQKLPEGGGLLSVQNSNVLTCLKVHQSIDKKILVDANVLEERMCEVLALWGRYSNSMSYSWRAIHHRATRGTRSRFTKVARTAEQSVTARCVPVWHLAGCISHGAVWTRKLGVARLPTPHAAKRPWFRTVPTQMSAQLLAVETPHPLSLPVRLRSTMAMCPPRPGLRAPPLRLSLGSSTLPVPVHRTQEARVEFLWSLTLVSTRVPLEL